MTTHPDYQWTLWSRRGARPWEKDATHRRGRLEELAALDPGDGRDAEGAYETLILPPGETPTLREKAT